MPKEVIKTGTFNTVVGWGNGGVQIATTMPEPENDADPKNLGELMATWDEGSQDMATGLWATLNREEINRLIRTLRRARDSHFGRDE